MGEAKEGGLTRANSLESPPLWELDMAMWCRGAPRVLAVARGCQTAGNVKSGDGCQQCNLQRTTSGRVAAGGVR